MFRFDSTRTEVRLHLHGWKLPVDGDDARAVPSFLGWRPATWLTLQYHHITQYSFVCFLPGLQYLPPILMVMGWNLGRHATCCLLASSIVSFRFVSPLYLYLWPETS